MNSEEWESCYARGLAFFGRVSANVSHEVKNHLAVINELGGLLQDLSLMADQKQGLDPTRVQNIADNIVDQIKQCDSVIKAFNYFSHSVDKTVTSVDLAEFTEKMVTITKRLATIKGAKLEFEPGPEQHSALLTNPFLLEQLYYFCLEHIISAATSGLVISVRPGKTETSGQLLFSCQEPVPGDMPDHEYIVLLKRTLNASTSVSADRKTFVLSIKNLST
ncbi:MAG: hypothetical protein R6X11_04640 [Desulfonatronovibrio sp.]